MSKEIMQQALTVLKAWDAVAWRTLDTIEGLEAALAQPEQDWDLLAATQDSLREHMAKVKELEAQLAQPEQEFKYTPYDLRSDENNKLSIDKISQREWVGLTVGEVIDIQNCNRGFWTNAAKIEQLLKDKNT